MKIQERTYKFKNVSLGLGDFSGYTIYLQRIYNEISNNSKNRQFTTKFDRFVNVSKVTVWRVFKLQCTDCDCEAQHKICSWDNKLNHRNKKCVVLCWWKSITWPAGIAPVSEWRFILSCFQVHFKKRTENNKHFKQDSF